MDAPVPVESMPVVAAAPETQPVIATEEAAVPQGPENTTTEAEAPAPAPAPAGTRKVSRPVQPPQKGTTLFPIARVSKIIKVRGIYSQQADSAVDICSKEATFLISVATELFVKKFAEEGCTNARLDKRKMVRYDDMGTSDSALTRVAKAVAQNEYLDFLREIVPNTVPLPVAMKQREERMHADVGQDPTEAAEPEEAEDEDAVVDESMAEEPAVDASVAEWQAVDENDVGAMDDTDVMMDSTEMDGPAPESYSG
ncbi:DNA-directed DNA polymerase [Malassezia caprae]|uniref:DNA-directed DNA polymerase n=1 Tax=Malassezia caprae TaxID=1381934 RepID=A0AAF0E476_9BASI|nr:DNA-directed DNA polymerase [Malassezia caprae]